MLDRMTEGIDFHGKALQLRARRQEVLSSNIANADTPGFKARDFDFSKALAGVTGLDPAAVSAGADGSAGPIGAAGAGPVFTSTVGLSRSQAGHIAGAGLAARGAAGGAVQHATSRLQYVTPEQGTLDGNTVDLNRERAQFADNALRYEAALRFINGKVRTMMTAIRGE